MSAARPRRNVAKITTWPQCGGDKLQGLAPHATKFSVSGNNNYQYSAQSGDGRDRRLIYLTNQLAGGVGRHRGQFRNNADGARRGSGCHDPPELEIINDPHDNGNSNILHVNNYQVIIYAGREGTLSLSEGSVTPSYVSRGTHTIRLHINPSEKNFEIYMSELTLTDKANNKTRKNLNPFAINSEDFEEAHIDDITREGIGSFLTFTIEFADKKQHNLDNISLNTNYGDISINNSSISTTTNDLTYSIIAGPFLYGLEYTNLTLTVNPTKGSNVVYTDSVKYGGLGNHTPNGSYKLLEYTYVNPKNNFEFNGLSTLDVFGNPKPSIIFTERSILPYYKFLPSYSDFSYGSYSLDLSNTDISFTLEPLNGYKTAADLSMESSFNLLYFDQDQDIAESQRESITNFFNIDKHWNRLPTSGILDNLNSKWKWNTKDILTNWDTTTGYRKLWNTAEVTRYDGTSTERNNEDLRNKGQYDDPIYHVAFPYIYWQIKPENQAGFLVNNANNNHYVGYNRPPLDGAVYLREHTYSGITELEEAIVEISNNAVNFTYGNSIPFRGFLIRDNCNNLIDSSLLSENNKMIPITKTILPPDSNIDDIKAAIENMYSR